MIKNAIKSIEPVTDQASKRWAAWRKSERARLARLPLPELKYRQAGKSKNTNAVQPGAKT